MKSEDTYKLEAYSLDGRFLWRHDMGWSIEAGTWYASYVVYELDGDGKAEVYCKGDEGDTLLTPPGADRPQMVADLLGDWREELVVATGGELRIYTTTIPAATRRACLMQDRLYRLYVATNSMGYNTSPQHSNP